MDITQLLVIQQFLDIREKSGPEAAIAWAEAETAKLEGRESSDKQPHLRIVGS